MNIESQNDTIIKYMKEIYSVAKSGHFIDFVPDTKKNINSSVEMSPKKRPRFRLKNTSGIGRLASGLFDSSLTGSLFDDVVKEDEFDPSNISNRKEPVDDVDDESVTHSEDDSVKNKTRDVIDLNIEE